METLIVMLSPTQFKSLMWLTGCSKVNANEFIKWYPEFLPEEIKELAEDKKYIEFHESLQKVDKMLTNMYARNLGA